MRLSLQRRNAICENAKINFGEASYVWLFGSGVDDKKVGGRLKLVAEWCVKITNPPSVMNW